MVVFYDLEQHRFHSELPTTFVVPQAENADDAADPVICRCLQVRQSTVVRAVDEGARSLCQIACTTGAGGGCTACHRRLRSFFAAKRRAEEPIVPALAPALQDALDHGELNVEGSFCGDSACLSGGCHVLGTTTSPAESQAT
ncbi:MAG: (2Fe-2S)-binding protein [Pirellulales bacterium]